ncbi:hypothetical protein NGM36_06340 [Streptomyces mutabilis]|uniref:hypothetical protein n=1 Tax=Streptomyces mutabilis TaxID=67332 RepID=UPI0022BA51A4|nr:hypothetical protein [Streptomyces mutabilis]MCZ9349415.1 hypothetical protein [Streptomyces mutabilis]
MRDVAPFLGLTSPVRRAQSRTVLEGAPWSAEPDRRSAAGGCPSAGPYTAVDLLRRHVTHCSSGFPSEARLRALHHPRREERTDTDRLFGGCLRRCGRGDFFAACGRRRGTPAVR